MNIGPCETCGVVDHHLVEGMCPHCRIRYGITPAPAAHQSTTTLLTSLQEGMDEIFGATASPQE